MELAKNFFGSFDGNGVGGTGSVVHCSSGVRTLWTGLLRCGSAHEAHFHSQGAKLRNRSEYVEVWGACVVVLVKRVCTRNYVMHPDSPSTSSRRELLFGTAKTPW